MPKTLEKLPQPQQLETGREQITGSEIILDFLNESLTMSSDTMAMRLLKMKNSKDNNTLGLDRVNPLYTREAIESAALSLYGREGLTQQGIDAIKQITNIKPANNIKTFSRK